MSLEKVLSQNRKNLQEKMYVSLFVKISSFWSYLSLKIVKKAKNVRCGHIHDTTAFFWGLEKI